ncbi:phage integrase SAM-like domain-containing protein, partial [Pseudomonas aeruginosa]|uniref:phage integrase SAM-like domain-containing protein n=1 Tax=Pseudomonas aeruginosa TaxID=287 RepID=UPI003F801B17
TPQQLTEEYIFAHDLREASAKIYRAATKALLKHFGPTATVQEVDHRSVLGWRRKVLEQGLSKRSWNTYSNHLRTIWGYAIEHELVTHSQVNPFRKTTVIPPRRASKTVAAEAILRARNWLNMQVGAERCTGDRARITPAWFWLSVTVKVSVALFDFYAAIFSTSLTTRRSGFSDTNVTGCQLRVS